MGLCLRSEPPCRQSANQEATTVSRATRNWIDHGCYHITHRCHERKLLFRFRKHRAIYFDHLRQMSQRFRVSVLDYVVTCNHVHLLLWARQGATISRAVQFLGSSGKCVLLDV